MRTDVKLGLVGSLVVVVVAGWYFTGQDKSEPAILIQDGSSSTPPTTMLSGVTPEDSARETADAGATDPGGETPDYGQADTAGEPLADLFAAEDDETENPFDEDQDQPAEGVAGGEGGAGDPAVQTSAADPGAARRLGRATAIGREPESSGTASLGSGPSGVRMETHTVRPGDTIAQLARMYYGDVSYARVLRQANPQVVDPTAMAVGTVLVIPDAGDLDPASASRARPTRTRPTIPGRRVHTVQEGDTLFSIAGEHLGTGSRWDELYGLNKAVIGNDPGVLKVGQVLTLPPR